MRRGGESNAGDRIERRQAGCSPIFFADPHGAAKADLEALRCYAMSITFRPSSHVSSRMGRLDRIFLARPRRRPVFLLVRILSHEPRSDTASDVQHFGWYATTFWMRRFRFSQQSSGRFFSLSLAMGVLPSQARTSSLPQPGKPHCRWEELCLRAKVDVNHSSGRGYNCDRSGNISYRYLELRLFARRITHLWARFSPSLCVTNCHYLPPSLVVPCAKISMHQPKSSRKS
jgi:hypothetical protein